MLRISYDAIIIGGGIAGMELARILASQDKKVALVEKDRLGGTALREGALPIKKILDAFKQAGDMDQARKNLLAGWKKDLTRLDEVINERTREKNISVYYGSGRFVDRGTYEITGYSLNSPIIIVATGTEPYSPLNLKIDEEYIISHRSVIDLKRIPEKVIILGGSVEGVELAFLYLLLGSQLILVEKEARILDGEDPDLVAYVEEALVDLGGEIIKGVGASKLEVRAGSPLAYLEDGSILRADQIVMALARKPSLPLGLYNLDLELDQGFIRVDENFQTNIGGIYAIGDINGVHGMAHVASHQARILGKILGGQPHSKGDYSQVPRSIFSLPEIAGAGLNEEDCRKLDIEYSVGKSFWKVGYRSWAKSMDQGFVKVLVDRQGRLLGIWMVGDQVSDYVGFFTYFIKNKVAGQDLLDSLVISPSIYESIKDALEKALD